MNKQLHATSKLSDEQPPASTACDHRCSAVSTNPSTTDALQGARAKLSQDLVALWGDGSPAAAQLFRRVFPAGLLRFLTLPRPQPPPQSRQPPRQGQGQGHQQQQQQPSLRSADSLAPRQPSLPSDSRQQQRAPLGGVLPTPPAGGQQAPALDPPGSGRGGGGSSGGGSALNSPRGSESGSVAGARATAGSGDGDGGAARAQAAQRRRRSGAQPSSVLLPRLCAQSPLPWTDLKSGLVDPHPAEVLCCLAIVSKGEGKFLHNKR